MATKDYSEIRSKIRARVVELVNLANEKWPNLALPVPTVSFALKGTTAGTARFMSNHLKFNDVLAGDNWDVFDNTISHEVAHLVTFRLYPRAKQAHGPQFKIVHRLLGGNGKTHHEYDVSSVKSRRNYIRYEAKCICTTHHITKAMAGKISMRRAIFCTKCKEILVLTGNRVIVSM